MMTRLREWLKEILKRNQSYCAAVFGMLILILILNLLGLSTGFCNLYADFFYPILATVIGLMTSFLPFAVGEIIMYLAALTVLTAALIWIPGIFLRKKKGFTRFLSRFYQVFVFLIVWGLFVYTLNWFLPFRSSILGKKDSYTEREYALEEFRTMYYHVVDQLNADARLVPRDADGHIIYYTREEQRKLVENALHNISEEYPRLAGYYPPIKEALCSTALHWMSIGGFTYPYTMEMTCGKYLTELYYPVLYAHEASHHKGYYRESEANFLSYLALAKSEDPLLRYSANVYILSYIDEAYYATLWETGADQRYFDEYDTRGCDPQVNSDIAYARKMRDEAYRQDKHMMEELQKVAEKVADTGWEAQAAFLGEDGYDSVVLLMMDYYDGKLY